jgi:uncharacterized protein (DUF302 family)
LAVISSHVAPGASNGLASLASPFTFAETVQRLLAAFAEHDIKVFAVIDQRAEAIAAGLSMPPTTLILFGNPKAGTPVMVANLPSGIDLPLKALVIEPDPGRVEVVINTAAYLIERHGLPESLLANLAPAERLITATLSS